LMLRQRSFSLSTKRGAISKDCALVSLLAAGATLLRDAEART